jgi:uncharacterized protein (TIGR03790 family)
MTVGPLVILNLCGALSLQAAPLTAGDLLLVYNGTLPDSRALAEHYAEVRGVPRDRLCPLTIRSGGEEIAAAEFDHLIREPIRQYLEQHQLRDRVRCLVTLYGLPIRVGKQTFSPAHRQLAARLRPQLDEALVEFELKVNNLDRIAGGAAPPLSAKPPTEADYPSLVNRYLKVREAAGKRVAALPATTANNEIRQKWLDTMESIEGLSFIAAQAQPGPGQNQAAAADQLRRLRESVERADSEVKALLARGIDSPEREKAYPLVRQYHGLLGTLTALMNDVHLLQPDETEAAVDSELMLLWWDDYPKYRWVVNTLNWQRRAEAERQFQRFEPLWLRTTLMVSRIDASTPAIARRMIDQAAAAEKTGLSGTVYIDARGLKAGEGLGQYDEDLRKLARLLSTRTRLSVRLDDRPELFQPGQCPNTMLYCGWYSLRKYVDAFTFVPGAVGYHIASFEAASLKGPNEQGWCKRMLDRGITATLGPVAEPYLQSFPPPSEFFGLLLTGRYTLAECYAYTLPFASWMQMLLGDPLYRPFVRRPLLKVSDVFDDSQIPAEFKAETASPSASQPAPRPVR